MKYALSVLLAASLLLCCGCTAKQPQTIPETAVLIEVSWMRTTSSADDGFWFTAGRPQWDTEAEGHFLNCEYRAADGELIERRDAPISDAQWAGLEALARGLTLRHTKRQMRIFWMRPAARSPSHGGTAKKSSNAAMQRTARTRWMDSCARLRRRRRPRQNWTIPIKKEIIMGLFDKKYCDICGDKIGLLGNRKLEDGNCRKNCAKKLSPWFNERRHSTVGKIKRQLTYREENQAKAAQFQITQELGK